MIKIRNLLFQYPNSQFSLHIEDLNVAEGEKVAFVGPSGSGKSTLLNLISGIANPQQGSIEVAGHDVTAMSEPQRRNFRISNIGFVFQQFELIPYLGVRDNVLLPFLINQSLRLDDDCRKNAHELIERVGLGDKLKRFPHQLSQGEQQRAAICRALVNRPQLVLADEPTGNLDGTNKLKMLELLFQHRNVSNWALVVVTHDTHILGGFDRVIDVEPFQFGRATRC